MIAKREIRNYIQSTKVWAGKYRNSHNLLHWHYDCELMYVDNGSIDVNCEKRTHRLKQGDALFVDSGQVHFQRARDRETVLTLIIFDYGIVKPYLGDVRLLSPKLSGDYEIPAAYAKLRSILLGKQEFYGAEAASEVLRLMVRIFRGEPLTSRRETDTSKTFKRLLEDVSENCSDYTFDGAAAFMNMSDAYFSRYFHAATGITFSQYLNFARTMQAVTLLHAGEDLITDVSEKCGFGTVRNFNRIFKEVTGYTPKTLPADFTLDEKFLYPSEESFNPTLYDCELIESVD